MKLFKIATHIESDKFQSNVFLCVGKCIRSNMAPYGWYVRLELPIIKIRTFLCHQEFIYKTVKCRKVHLWRSIPDISKLIHLYAWIKYEENNTYQSTRYKGK